MADFYCDEVLSGRTPVERIFESENVLAFLHTRPYYRHHVVVIPKRHIESLLALGEEDAALATELLAAVREVAAEVVAAEGGAHVVTNIGAYQDSKHLHFHIGADRADRHPFEIVTLDGPRSRNVPPRCIDLSANTP
ncbi:MAG: HIT domain-containing protein [Tepidiformaceae bacterium]